MEGRIGGDDGDEQNDIFRSPEMLKDEVTGIAGRIKAWGVASVLPQGLTVGDIQLKPSVSQDQYVSLGDAWQKGNPFDKNVNVEKNTGWYFFQCLAASYDKAKNDDDFGKGIKDLLGKVYLVKSTDESKDLKRLGVVIYHDASNANGRYQCNSLRAFLDVSPQDADRLVEVLKSKPDLMEVFIEGVFPNIDNEIKRYPSDGVFVIENGIPEGVKTNAASSLDNDDLKKYKNHFSNDTGTLYYKTEVS